MGTDIYYCRDIQLGRDIQMMYKIYKCPLDYIFQTKEDSIHAVHLHTKQIVQTKSSPADVKCSQAFVVCTDQRP